MAIKSELTGGSIGEVASWSVQEYATPVAIGDTAGGTGNVSVTTAATSQSIFAINENITTTHDAWGAVSGIVKNVSTSGINASMSHSTILGLYDVEKVIPYLYDSSVEAAIGAANIAIADSEVTSDFAPPTSDYYFTGTTGTFWSCAGVFTGVDKNNNAVKPSSSKYSETLSGTNYGGENLVNTMLFESIKIIDGIMYVNNVTGDSMYPIKSSVTYRTVLEGANNSVSISTGDAIISHPKNLYYDATLTIDYAAQTLTLSGNRQTSSSSLTLTPFTSTTSLASIDLDSEIIVSLSKSGAGSYLTARVYSADFSTTVSLSSTLSIKNSYWKPYVITGNARAIWRYGTANAPTAYEHGTPPTFPPIPDNPTPVPAVKMNVWEYLQAACSANGKELYILNGQLAVRDIGTNVIDITNIVASPTLSPSATNAGNFIDIVYHNTKAVIGGELYNARNDDNKTFSVKAGQVVKVSVASNASATFLLQPIQTETFVTAPGTYYVMGADKLPVPIAEWEAYGGKLEVAINKENNYSIDVTITGPMTAIPVHDGPYVIGISDDGNDFGALSISGIGVVTDDKTLHLATGADHEKTTQEVAKTVNNPFISTRLQAYDRGVWASIDASGPKMSFSGVIPASSIEGFGLTAGSLVRYFDSIYRITDVTISNASASFTATRYVTVDDFDGVWSGLKVTDHDLLWDIRTNKDQVIAPLYFIGNDESVIMILDTDGVPYYAVTGIPDISVLVDTDGAFYFVDGAGASGEVAVYLDEDNNPYA